MQYPVIPSSLRCLCNEISYTLSRFASFTMSRARYLSTASRGGYLFLQHSVQESVPNIRRIWAIGLKRKSLISWVRVTGIWPEERCHHEGNQIGSPAWSDLANLWCEVGDLEDNGVRCLNHLLDVIGCALIRRDADNIHLLLRWKESAVQSA